MLQLAVRKLVLPPPYSPISQKGKAELQLQEIDLVPTTVLTIRECPLNVCYMDFKKYIEI